MSSQRFARRNRSFGYVTSLEIRRPGNREGEKPRRFDVPTNNVSSRHKGESPGGRGGSGFTEETLCEGAFSRRKWPEDERTHPAIRYEFRARELHRVNIPSGYCANVSLSTRNVNSDYPMA